MYKYYLFSLSLLFFTANLVGQLYPFYKHYELDPTTSQIEREADSDLMYYYNKYALTIEYEYDAYYGSFFKYRTYHYRVKLNTDAAIEEFNKIYIPLEDVVDVELTKARLIKKDEIVEVEIEMEEFFSEDEDEQYYYFPIAGLELGDELEILYTTKMQPAFNGDQFYFQGEVPIYNFDFKFIVPNDSYFEFLGHNGLPKPTLVDTILQRNEYILHLDSIPALESEYFSAYNNIILKLDASLKSSIGDDISDYSPYQVYVDYANETFHEKPTAAEQKMLKKLNKKLGVSPLNKELDNIRKIENYMKNDFLIGYGAPNMSIRQMLEQEKGDGIGALLVFMKLLEQANILFDYGLIADRYDTHFSSEIESSYFLQNYLFYFPRSDKYLAPLDFSTRVGYLDYQWIPNNALFVKKKKLAHEKTSYKIKSVPSTHYTDNQDSLIITINVNEAMNDAEIKVERHLLGYDAGEYQAYYYIYNESKKKESQDELLNFFKNNSRFKMTSIANVDVTSAFSKPIIIKGELISLDVPIFEKAGAITIFKLGHLFGEYLNPKELEKKKHDFVFGHPFMSSTTIIVNFPKNVTIKNQASIQQFKNLSKLPNLVLGSELTIKSNQLVYKQREEFHSNVYPIEEKEELMKVFHFYSDLSKMNLIIQ